MTDENTTPPAEQAPTEGEGRPGGPPERTLATERIEALEATIADLSKQIKAGNLTASEHKEAKNTVEQQIAEMKATQDQYARELRMAKVETAAAKVGAKDPDLVARLVEGEENHLAAIDRLKADKPYLFGAPSRPAGADMNGGSGTRSDGLTDLDKHLAERFGT